MRSEKVSLVMIRHGTAETPLSLMNDQERRLTEIGIRDVSRIAEATLAASYPKADLAVTSGYVRAEETRRLFGWIGGQVLESENFSPLGDLELAADELRQVVADGVRSIWLFSHNPFLTDALSSWSPGILDWVANVRKSDCIWLRWQNSESFLKERPRLCGYLRRPKGG